MATLYSTALLLVFTLSAADALRISARRDGTRDDYTRAVRRSMLPTLLLLLFHTAVAMLAFAAGYWKLFGTLSVFFIASTCFLPLLGATGQVWAAQNGLSGSAYLQGRLPEETLHGRLPILPGLLLLPVFAGAALVIMAPWKVDPALTSRLSAAGSSHHAKLFFTAYLVISAPVVEEIIWRHYFINRIAGPIRGSASTRWITAIFISALIFAMGHTGMIQPLWVKALQVLTMAITAGVAQVIFCTEAAILVHFVFNVSSAALAVVLF